MFPNQTIIKLLCVYLHGHSASHMFTAKTARLFCLLVSTLFNEGAYLTFMCQSSTRPSKMVFYLDIYLFLLQCISTVNRYLFTIFHASTSSHSNLLYTHTLHKHNHNKKKQKKTKNAHKHNYNSSVTLQVITIQNDVINVFTNNSLLCQFFQTQLNFKLVYKISWDWF